MRTGTLKAARRAATWRRSAASSTAAPGFTYHGAHLFAEHAMGNADDGGVHDRRVAVERVLDLDAVDVLAAADQHVFGAVEDVEKAIGVEAHEVAGMKPAVGEARVRRLGIVPIA